ncbi:undecaprenyl diphosphate synthase family protein [Paenibacillus spongiae]|uniref:Undecaprenyl diphosphate synthase family protein n=1 Tax=Paenibacillus spongiae TaxID=2909671 RepID=A0ABY5S1E6_9BACL|nr:undecaprenyl diphosphate synthase family protein [Paenibacillus spongiae]UVI27434.1 undecaprenyl diphosphate synthase family protein [Paenibacillus spongiae]
MKWSGLNRTKSDLKRKIDWSNHLPKHIAIMMDGNGRWANRIRFSTENWKRPKDEVEYIISLVSEFVQDTNVRELNENNIKVFFIGDISKFPEFLYTGKNPCPDLLIRTSGEKRLSNFLLWQSAHTELWFTNEMWPDFNEELLHESILDYQNRKKRT